MHKLLSVILAAGLFTALPSTHPDKAAPRSVGQDEFRPAIEYRPIRNAVQVPREHGCIAHTISCGQTLTSEVGTHDCRTTRGVLFDIWFFQATKGQTITATLTSNDFDPFLILFDPDVNVIAEDDDSGPGNAAEIQFTVDETSAVWSLVATPLARCATGSYALSLQCSGSPPPPPPQLPEPSRAAGFFNDAKYPDFCFRVNITPAGQAPILGTPEPSCTEDTVCVSGALAGRSEVFIRILGPRPNGFLWPTITRFTPSRVDVEMFQLSSGDSQSYTLDAVPAASDDLSGLQDRTGFQP